MSTKRDFLTSLLACGPDDLEMLEDVRYDFDEVIDQLDDFPLQKVGFNGLMRAVVDVGIIHIKDAIDSRICELIYIRDAEGLDSDEMIELRLLRELNPDEDIKSYHNYFDTHVWIEYNGAIYRRYMTNAIEDFENGTGLSVRNDASSTVLCIKSFVEDNEEFWSEGNYYDVVGNDNGEMLICHNAGGVGRVYPEDFAIHFKMVR